MERTVSTQDLRVGMYIHLGLGWMHHPFPLSSFRITSPDQIETIRALGLAQVRWVPDRSALAPAHAWGVTPAPAPAPRRVRARKRPPAAAAGHEPQALAHRAAPHAPHAPHAGQRLLERQYAEATAALHGACRNLRAQPAQARQDIESLSRALVDKLLVDGEMCIRLLSTTAGDRSTAHGMNVAVIALLVGRVLGLDAPDMMDLGVGALLHDMGKVELPDRVRHLDEGFGSADVKLYRDHVRHGVVIGQRMGLAPGAMAVIAQHHEHADGSGFPLQLSGERLAMGSRIIALANRYDNLCNPTVPSRALTPHEALSSLFAAGRQRFDLGVLNAFIRMMGVYPAGSVVQLTDDRYALVVGVNASRPLKPRVLVHDPRRPRDDPLVLSLEQVRGLGIRRSLAASGLPPAARQALTPRQRVTYFFEPLAGPPEETCT